MTELAIESTATAHLTVRPLDLASNLEIETAEAFPAVFATSRMVALMEVAAARLLSPQLREGELSVGVTMDIKHTAATPPGGSVTATAKFVGREGKLFVFEVSAADDAGEIGRGTHRRAIISTERLLAGAAQRGPKS
jgi:fluoroacetyl-CoA thioesterase